MFIFNNGNMYQNPVFLYEPSDETSVLLSFISENITKVFVLFFQKLSMLHLLLILWSPSPSACLCF